MKRPWMPLYINDFQMGTLGLKPDEIGVYLIMLMLAWRSDDGSITGDMNELKSVLQRLANLHGLAFNRIVPKLLDRYFERREDGRFYQERVEKELRKVRERSEKQSRIARKRWSAFRKNKDLADATAMPSHSHSHSHKNKKERESAAPSGAAPHTNQDEPKTKRVAEEVTEEPLPSSDNPSLRNSRDRRGSRLSADWKLSAEDEAFARTGLTVEAIGVEAEKFRNHWIAAPGQKGVKRDWSATWRNWCLKSRQWNPGQAKPAEAKPSLTEDQINKLFERYRRKQGLTAGSSMEH